MHVVIDGRFVLDEADLHRRLAGALGYGPYYRHDLDDRSLVLVSPFFPLAEQRRFQLRADLEALPDDMTVVIVVTHESEVPPRVEVGQG